MIKRLTKNYYKFDRYIYIRFDHFIIGMILLFIIDIILGVALWMN